MIAHNGEINTLRGNNWMAARQALVSSPKFGTDISCGRSPTKASPDTACFDNALERPWAAIRPPTRWTTTTTRGVRAIRPDERGARLLRIQRRADGAWTAPAAIAFTNGRQIGATLDRNGLRPARYIVTRDDRIIMASEVGVLPITGTDRHQVAAAAWQDAAGRPRDPAHSRRGAQGQIALSHPYREWLDRTEDFKSKEKRRRLQRPRRFPTWHCSIASRPSATTRRI